MQLRYFLLLHNLKALLRYVTRYNALRNALF